MNIRELTIFINVAKSLNITKTAKEMFLAQPSLTFAIKELEKEYNVKLFNRIKQRLVLTEAGKELLIYAKKIIADISLFELKANNLSLKPKLNFAASLSVGEKYLAEFLAKYDSLFDFTWHFNIVISSAIINKVLSGDYDFGIIESEVNSNSLEVINLLIDKIILVAKNDYPIAKELTIEELMKYPLIVRDKLSGTRDFTDNLFNKNNLEYSPLCEASTNTSLLSFVKNGLGIGILPSIIAEESLKNKEIKEIKIKNLNLERSIKLIYLKNKKLTEEEQKLVKYIVSFFKEINV